MTRPPVPHPALELTLPREASAARAARAELARRFGAELQADTLHRLQLVASELVSNAYLHGRGEIRLRAGTLADAVRVEVVDEGDPSRVGIRPRPGADGGWGLRIVDRLARRWGAFEGTTHVWAELAL